MGEVKEEAGAGSWEIVQMDAGLGQAGMRDDYFEDLFEDTAAGKPKDSSI